MLTRRWGFWRPKEPISFTPRFSEVIGMPFLVNGFNRFKKSR
jgi:hypothetical protein